MQFGHAHAPAARKSMALANDQYHFLGIKRLEHRAVQQQRPISQDQIEALRLQPRNQFVAGLDRKSVGSGKSVSVRVDLGGLCSIKKKKLTVIILHNQ